MISRIGQTERQTDGRSTPRVDAPSDQMDKFVSAILGRAEMTWKGIFVQADKTYKPPSLSCSLEKHRDKSAEETEEQLIAQANSFLSIGESRMKPTSAPTTSPYCRCETQHPRQRAERNQILLSGSRHNGGAAERRRLLHRDFRERSDTTGQWFLVIDGLQRASLLRAKRT